MSKIKFQKIIIILTNALRIKKKVRNKLIRVSNKSIRVRNKMMRVRKIRHIRSLGQILYRFNNITSNYV